MHRFGGLCKNPHYVQERGNWQAVMRFILEQRDPEAALRLAGGLGIFLLVWGYGFDQRYLLEGRDLLEQTLSASVEIDSPARAWALSVSGGTLGLLGDFERSTLACRAGL